MKFLVNTIFLCVALGGMAQQIVVKDAITQEVLPGVSIYDIEKSHFETSSENGKAELDRFHGNAILSFSYMGYEMQNLQKSQIKPMQVIWMTPNTEQLGEIVLSVSRSSNKKQRLAQQVGILSKEEIAQISPENAAVLLREVPGVRVQQSQGGGGSPVLRGFEANRVLLVVDGVRLNNAIFRSGHVHNALSVDPLSLSRAEVIFGPSSVGYGSDALGGVIHFYTRTPLINQNKKLRLAGSSSYTFNQNTSKQSVVMEYSASKWAVLQQVSYSQFGDIVMGERRAHGYENWGKVFEYSQNSDTNYTATPSKNNNPNVQRNSAYEQVDFLQKWIYHTTNGIKFTLNLQGSQSGDIPRFDKLSEIREGELRFARWEYGPQKRLLISPQMSFVGNKPWLHSGKIIAAVQVLEESRIQRKFASLNRETQREQLTVYSLNADFTAKTRKGRDWSYGLEMTHNKVRSSAYAQELNLLANNIIGLKPKTAIPTRYPSDGSTYATFAGYVDYRYDINPKSTLSLGARHTITALDAAWSEQALIDAKLAHAYQKHQSSNITLGYSYTSNSQWQLKALFSTGFRAPNIDDLGKTRENRGILSVPNLELNPEYIYSTDIGIRKQWNKGSFFEINGYYAFVNDYMARVSHQISYGLTSNDEDTAIFSEEEVQITTNANVGTVDVYGFNTQSKWMISPKISYQNSLTYTRGIGNNISGNLPSISPLFITQKVQWQLPKGEISLHWHHAKRKTPDTYSPWGEDGLEETPLLANNIFAGTPAWHRWDMQFVLPLSNTLNLSGGIFNLWDTHYREFASGISAPGRSVKLVLRYEL
ncbi:MAG: TonB-dependent receptor [Bacteroidetes bacterium]|nr:TonB-dependent receptor [Bacteroidota bacterium]